VHAVPRASLVGHTLIRGLRLEEGRTDACAQQEGGSTSLAGAETSCRCPLRVCKQPSRDHSEAPPHTTSSPFRSTQWATKSQVLRQSNALVREAAQRRRQETDQRESDRLKAQETDEHRNRTSILARTELVLARRSARTMMRNAVQLGHAVVRQTQAPQQSLLPIIFRDGSASGSGSAGGYLVRMSRTHQSSRYD
jgi:hypothetical protein